MYIIKHGNHHLEKNKIMRDFIEIKNTKKKKKLKVNHRSLRTVKKCKYLVPSTYIHTHGLDNSHLTNQAQT